MDHADGERLHPTARAFDGVGELYDRHRPGYPPAAVQRVADQLEIAPGRRVLDLAAGTGKLTREWVARGAEVIAVEPVAGMRTVLAERLPGIEILDGSAEAMPLDDASVAAATVGHAFHWFDAAAALAELHRVIAPGGGLAVLFNRRDLTTGVQAAIDELLTPYRGDTPSWNGAPWDAPLLDNDWFESLELARVPFTQQLDKDELAGRVASISFVARLDDRSRDRIADALHELFEAAATPDATDTPVVTLAYVCEVRLLMRRDARRSS